MTRQVINVINIIPYWLLLSFQTIQRKDPPELKCNSLQNKEKEKMATVYFRFGFSLRANSAACIPPPECVYLYPCVCPHPLPTCVCVHKPTQCILNSWYTVKMVSYGRLEYVSAGDSLNLLGEYIRKHWTLRPTSILQLVIETSINQESYLHRWDVFLCRNWWLSSDPWGFVVWTDFLQRPWNNLSVNWER